MGGSSSSSKSEPKNEQIVPAQPQLTPEEQEELRKKMQLENNMRIIEKAKSDSASLRAAAVDLKQKVSQFWNSIDPNNPDISHKKELESLKKTCLSTSEALMRILFSLDSIVESPETRNERKQIVLDVQETLAALDEIKSALQPVLDKLKELEPPQEEIQDNNQQPSTDATQAPQTQDNNTTTASDSTSKTVDQTEAQTVDTGII